MSNKIKPVAAVLGTTFAVSLMASPLANAEQNPFEINELTSGYMQLADGHGEGSCGEGSCGENKGEGSCGEGSCGESEGEGSCGEGSCGEG